MNDCKPPSATPVTVGVIAFLGLLYFALPYPLERLLDRISFSDSHATLYPMVLLGRVWPAYSEYCVAQYEFFTRNAIP